MSTLANKKFHFTWARVSRPLPSLPLVHPSLNIAKLVGRVVLDHCGVHDGIDLAFVVLHGVFSCSPLARCEWKKLFGREGICGICALPPPSPRLNIVTARVPEVNERSQQY